MFVDFMFKLHLALILLAQLSCGKSIRELFAQFRLEAGRVRFAPNT